MYNETSRQNAEEVHNSFRDFKQGFHQAKENASEKVFVDLNLHSKAEFQPDEQETKKPQTQDSLLSSRIDDRPDHRESLHDEKYIRSKNITTLRNAKKIIDKNQVRIDQYKKDLVDRNVNVENNLIKSK